MSSFFSKAGLLAVGALGLCVTTSRAQSSEITDQILEQLVQTTDYWVSLPDGYDANDTTTLWPTIFFLHGASESNRTGDVHPDIVRRIGPGWEVDKGKKLPFIIVSPHAGRNGWEPRVLGEVAKKVLKDYRIDPDRFYLTGMSMGGFGTWNFAKEYPHLFAAIAPVCGGQDTTDVHMLANVAIWAFHGAKDDVVAIEPHAEMVEVARQYNDNVQFKIFPEGNHHIYFEIYREDYLYDWLLKQTRHKHQSVGPIDRSILEKYVGTYRNDLALDWKIPVTVSENGTISVYDQWELIPLADNKFAFQAEYPTYLEFSYNEATDRMELHYRNVSSKQDITHFWIFEEE